MQAYLPRICLMLLGSILSFSLSGCGNMRGVHEFQLYTQSFDAQAEQGQVILNAVARAERTVVLRRIKGSGRSDTFNPDQAAYFVDSVDPPITASIRSSLTTVKNYNAALGALSNGEAVDALANRVGTIAGNVASAAAAWRLAPVGATAVPGAAQLAGEAGRALSNAAPIVKQIATIASREAFRHQLVASYEPMRDLLKSLRNGTPVMFEMLKRSRVRRGSLDTATGISASEQAELEKDRQLLAAWVLMLDKTLVAMEAAVTAAISDVSPTDIAALSDASIELKILAEKVRVLRAK